MMEHLNTINDLRRRITDTPAEKLALSEMIELTTLVLAPGAPHSADEIWSLAVPFKPSQIATFPISVGQIG